jgi:LacI family transcriptional regulator
MSETRRIAVLLDRSLGFVRDVIQGIRVYAAGRPHWILRDGPPRPHIVSQVRQWRPHGIIAGLVLRRVARELIQMHKPLIDTAYVLPGLNVPLVDVDHATVGRMAAEYFLERKFSHFGFFGSEKAEYSRAQESGFGQRVSEAGHSVASIYLELLPDLTNASIWRRSTQKIHQWLHRLAKPAAVLCCDDAPARYLADACAQIGLRVPDDVALLGVGNDQLDCNLTPPALSSMVAPSQRIGYEAAALLDRLMQGEAWSGQPLLLPPLHIVTRYSTDIMAVDDETVRGALQYIRQHAYEEMSVAELAKQIAVGRRLLERHFREVLGRSVLDEIRRVRVERAKELLIDTHLPIETVAARAGFSSARRLDVVFARLAGVSPSAYRRQAQARQHADHGYAE